MWMLLPGAIGRGAANTCGQALENVWFRGRRGKAVVGVAVVLIVALAAAVFRPSQSGLTVTHPDAQATKAMGAVIDPYLAGQQGPAEDASVRWFCATRILGVQTAGRDVTAYLWGLCEQAGPTGGGHISIGSGSDMNYVVHLVRHNGTLHAVSYKWPGDAPMYEPNVRKMFPGSIADQILSNAPTGVRAREAALRQMAVHAFYGS